MDDAQEERPAPCERPRTAPLVAFGTMACVAWCALGALGSGGSPARRLAEGLSGLLAGFVWSRLMVHRVRARLRRGEQGWDGLAPAAVIWGMIVGVGCAAVMTLGRYAVELAVGPAPRAVWLAKVVVGFPRALVAGAWQGLVIGFLGSLAALVVETKARRVEQPQKGGGS
jgi:hypothetical protein